MRDSRIVRVLPLSDTNTKPTEKMTTITYTDTAGRNISLTFAADYLLNSQGIRKTSGRKEVVIKATVNGNPISTSGGIRPVKGHAVAVASLGDLGFNAGRHAEIQAAIAAEAATFAGQDDKMMERLLADDAAEQAILAAEKADAFGE